MAKSRRIASICVLLSNAVIQSWTVSISWDSQDSPDWNPCWKWRIMSCLCRCFHCIAYNNVFHNFAEDACQWYWSVVSRVFLWIGVTSAWSQSLGSLPVLYDCWKMCVMMGAICSAVSWTLAVSLSGPVLSFILIEIFQWGFLDNYPLGGATAIVVIR